jgi:endonuclease V-like protein UPF0215 family
LSNPKSFHVIKPEIRALGIDDGKFVPHTKGAALIVGVVFRGGYSIEGVMSTHVEIDGLDATEKLASMVNRSPHRRQLRLVMLNGITFAGFNIVDLKKLNTETGLPIIALTNNKPDLEDINSALKNLPDCEVRRRLVLEAGPIHEVINHGVKVYVELAGITLQDAQKIIALTSARSCLPEPLRVAHLVASNVT